MKSESDISVLLNEFFILDWLQLPYTDCYVTTTSEENSNSLNDLKRPWLTYNTGTWLMSTDWQCCCYSVRRDSLDRSGNSLNLADLGKAKGWPNYANIGQYHIESSLDSILEPRPARRRKICAFFAIRFLWIYYRILNNISCCVYPLLIYI